MTCTNHYLAVSVSLLLIAVSLSVSGGIHRVGGSQSFVRASAGDVIVRGRYMEMTSHIWIGWRTQQQQPGVEACSEPKKVAAVILNTRDYYYYYKMYRLE